jgi:hypothetical protein
MRSCLSLILVLIVPLPTWAAEQPSIGLVSPKPGEPPVVEVQGLPETFAVEFSRLSTKERVQIFRVVVGGGTEMELLARPPLAGTYSLSEGRIRFVPQFPLVPGRDYVAILRAEPNAKQIRVTLAMPKPPPGQRVAITGIHPSASRLPENTLRFYIHFSGEVARGGVYAHLSLIRDDGVEVLEPFLEVPEELWSADGKRLTVLLHPGRVKRDLVPREELGPILEEGRSYTIRISGRWEDTEGRPLVAGFTKTFSVGPPDDEPVEPAHWMLMPPRAGSDGPLIVRLPKPLDHGMLNRVVWVVDASGESVPGTMTVGGAERVLTFAPRTPWRRGEYRLVIDTRLEDVCGNRVGEPFEVDVFKPVTRTIESRTVERSFAVR